jgi:hypothetical protein
MHLSGFSDRMGIGLHIRGAELPGKLIEFGQPHHGNFSQWRATNSPRSAKKGSATVA